MNIKQLIQITKKPEMYDRGTAVMWTDGYISTQLLETHLSQATDLASRKKSTIDSTVEWILEKVQGEKMNILDLGCGPGLYTEKLARKGHTVTGVDFSKSSISHARKSAKEHGLNISYRCEDYLTIDDENCYDLVMMIFTDFGVLCPDQRNALLQNIYRALKPGGIFLFDVLNDNYAGAADSRNWEAVEKGFWRPGPYLALSENIYYRAQKVILSQHVIIDEAGKTEIYRFWTHLFSDNDLAGILKVHNFTEPVFYKNVIPDSDSYRSGDVTFCICSRQDNQVIS